MIPTAEFLGSAPMTHKFGDFFNPPGLTNFIGAVHTEIDLTGISSLSFPPFATANQRNAMLFVNKRFFQATGKPITFTWYPDRIVRVTEYDGLKMKSVTVMTPQKMAVIIDLEVENRSGNAREVDLRLGLQGGITKSVSTWNDALPPMEVDNSVEIDSGRKAFLFSAQSSDAVMLMGSSPQPDKLVEEGLQYKLNLKSGESKHIYYVQVVDETATNAQNIFDAIVSNPAAEIQKARDEWNAELKAIFTPANNRYSGSLPILETKDEDILRTYLMSVLGVVYFKRDNPYSVYGRAYDTLLPVYWQSVTFIWDYALSSFTHALLDPAVMRKYLEKWMTLDIYSHFGTEYLTGGPVGYWYSANDFNMMTILKDYLRWSGDYKWLNNKISDPSQKSHSKTVLDFVEQYANNWKSLKSKNGLADYGEIDNLLECVSTYIHEVASLNAANVFNMRTASTIMDISNNPAKSSRLSADAKTLLQDVLKLYADGTGHWHTRFPDGKLVDVRHCYDFFTILNTIGTDLSRKQKDEMVGFFQRELQTPNWMRALAPSDSNSMFSVRPDHQWNGAYPAWPSHSLKALYAAEKPELAFDWLKSLSKSFNQGPLGQAHFVEDVIDAEQGGARKAPHEIPYITDWACTGGGSWVGVIIENLFGVKAELGGSLTANPQFGSFDSNAELHNLIYQGQRYHVTRNGLKKA